MVKSTAQVAGFRLKDVQSAVGFDLKEQELIGPETVILVILTLTQFGETRDP